MSPLLAIAAAPLLLLVGQCAPPPAADPAPLPACSGSIIEVAPGEYPGCDVTPPQIMIEVGTATADDCDRMGGTFFSSAWEGRPNLCIDLDY